MNEQTTKQAYNFEKTMELCLIAGRIMMYAGSETYRVEDTIIRISKACGLDSECFVTPTGIFLSLKDGGRVQTSMARILYRSIDLNKVSEVNSISRRLSQSEIKPREAFELLQELHSAPQLYPQALLLLCAGIASGSFSWLLGAQALDAMFAGATGLLVFFLYDTLGRAGTVSFLATFMSSILAASVALAFVSFTAAQELNIIVIGGIMPLLPGVALTNAVRDMINGDLMSGVARTAESILIAAAIAAGVIAVLAVTVI